MVLNRRGGRQPLFWVQPGFVQTSVLRQIDRAQPVFCLYRLETPDERVLSFTEIAAYHIETMRSLQPRGPYALAGFCICATIAYEMARQLTEQGETVSSLIMINPVDPAISRGDTLRDPLLFRLVLTLNRIAYFLRQLSQADDRSAHFRRSVRAIRGRIETRAGGGAEATPADEGPRRGNADVHSSDMRGFINCIPQPYAGPAILMRPSSGPAGLHRYENRRWQRIILGGVDVRMVPGNSDTMWTSHAQGVADAITASLSSEEHQRPALASAV
jgi:thioesterase domain-containing protein